MQNEPDAWVEKRRAQGCTTVVWNKWRETVTNPATPATDLEAAAASVLQKFSGSEGEGCVLEAIAAHPNAPPHLLVNIMERWSVAAYALCQNPVAPFLLLETPNFLALLDESAQIALLREADCPPVLVRLLAARGAAKSEAVQTAAHLHIAFAGEALENSEWETQVRDYFRNMCARDAEINNGTRHWNADLVEMGLAPSWANGSTPPPEPVAYAPYNDALEAWSRFAPAPDSEEEAALLERLNVTHPTVAKGLRATATSDDLRALLATGGQVTETIFRAVLRHPALNEEIFREVAFHAKNLDGLLAVHLLTPADVILRLLESVSPEVRRLVRRNPNARDAVADASRDAFLDTAMRGKIDLRSHIPPFASFIICQRLARERRVALLQDGLPERAEHLDWTTRLEAVLLVKDSVTRFTTDEARRTGDDLLRHLSRDGNRIVRAAARTRLADPNYKFIL